MPKKGSSITLSPLSVFNQVNYFKYNMLQDIKNMITTDVEEKPKEID